MRLLILTGQRREEIGALRWREVDLQERKITLPPERTKNNRPHDVPLSSPALAIVTPLPRRAGRDLVFGGEPRKARLPAVFKAGQNARPHSTSELSRSAHGACMI